MKKEGHSLDSRGLCLPLSVLGYSPVFYVLPFLHLSSFQFVSFPCSQRNPDNTGVVSEPSQFTDPIFLFQTIRIASYLIFQLPLNLI